MVGLELLVCLSTGLLCSLKRSGFSYVLFLTVVTLYHVGNVFGVAVNLMINKSNPRETETQTINVGKGVGNEVLQQAHITNTILV